MRLKVSLLVPLSIVLGLAAIQTGRNWLDRQMNDRMRRLEAQTNVKPVRFGTIVVAARALRFGSELAPSNLKEIPWPEDSLPKGSFARVSDVFREKAKRLVLSAIDDNEPILETKITGPGQKANLAAIIDEGMKAVTVRVDDVVGVAGFVLPGDRVDVLLTRRAGDKEAVSDNILQNLRVLAIDQQADERMAKPAVARAVTLEVSSDQAQRLIVAQSVGTLTLVLRPIGENGIEAGRRVTSAQLTGDQPAAPARRSEPAITAIPTTVTVGVIRGVAVKDYTVPVEQRR